MSEIWNLSEVCRCCHSSGVFKGLLDEFMYDGNVEVYSDLLRDVLAIEMQQPPFAASHTICDQCIMQLRFCWNFKRQVLECERKFEEYCKNELFNVSGGVKVEDFNGGDLSSGEHDDCEPLETNSNTPEVKPETEQPIKRGGRPKKRKRGRPKTSELTRREQICEGVRRYREKKQLAKKTAEGHITVGDKEIAKSNGINSSKENQATVEDPSYFCEYCSLRFNERLKLQNHVSEKHKTKALSCNICELTFKSEAIRALHMKKHISTRNGHKCQHCNKYYGSADALTNHTNSHSSEDLYQCDVCPKRFPHKYTLRRHTEWHKAKLKEIPVSVNKCDICLLPFRNPSELRSHIVDRHSLVKVREERRKVTKTRSKSKRIREYACVECNITFTTWGAMKRHKVKHSGVRPYVCDQCAMTFTNPDCLRKHFRSKHTIVEKETCSICNKKCADLKVHMKVHKRQFKCDRCPKSFPAGNALNSHVKFVHLCFRPHACDYCEAKYKTKTVLRRHILKRHNVEMVKTE